MRALIEENEAYADVQVIGIDMDRLKETVKSRAAQDLLFDLAQFEIDPHLPIYLAVDIRVVIIIGYAAGGKGGSQCFRFCLVIVEEGAVGVEEDPGVEHKTINRTGN